MKTLALIFAACALAQSQKISADDWKFGTLVSVQSGASYLGTGSTTTATGDTVRTLSAPIMRSDQVYVITGGGMEYVVTETGRSAAHVIVNAPIQYALIADKFYFLDEERRQHPARIARQTLLDRGAVMPVKPRVWKTVPGGVRFFVRTIPSESFYAEQLLTKKEKKDVPITYQGTWSANQFVGKINWTAKKCPFSREVNLTVKDGRIEGHSLSPAPGSKFDAAHCRYDQPFVPTAFVWVPE